MGYWQIDIDGDLLSPPSSPWTFYTSVLGGAIGGINEIHIDWGDGTTTTTTVDSGKNIPHSYSSTEGNRKHSIRITSYNVSVIYFRQFGGAQISSEAAVTKVYPIGGLPNLTSVHIDNSNITELPADLLQDSIDTLTSVRIENNTGLTELPTDLLKDFGKQLHLDTGQGINGNQMFRGSAIKGVPVGMLQQSYLNTLTSIFEGTDIEEVPVDIFKNLPMSKVENLTFRPRFFTEAFKDSLVREVVGEGPFFPKSSRPTASTHPVGINGIFSGSQLERVPRQMLDGVWNWNNPGPIVTLNNMFKDTPIDSAPPFWFWVHESYYSGRVTDMYAGTQSTIPQENYDYMPVAAGGGGMSVDGHTLPTVNWIKTEGNKITGEVVENGTTEVLWRGVVMSEQANQGVESQLAIHYSDYNGGLGEFTVKVPIEFNYYRVFAASTSGVSYSDVITQPRNPGKMLEFF